MSPCRSSTPAGGVVRTITRRRAHAPQRPEPVHLGRPRPTAARSPPTARTRGGSLLLGQGRTIQIATPITVRDLPPAPRVVAVTPARDRGRRGPASVTIRFAGVAAGDRVTAQIYRRRAPGPRAWRSASWSVAAIRRPGTAGSAASRRRRAPISSPSTASDGACGSGRSALAASAAVRVRRLDAMTALLRRLVSSLAAYQLADFVSKFIAVLLLPVYTRYINPSGYGTVELLANGVIFLSIFVRFGMIEAFLRFHFSRRRPGSARGARPARGRLPAAHHDGRRDRARGRRRAALSRLVLGHRDTTIFLIAVLGLWAFTNLELAYGLLRVRGAAAGLRDRVADQRAGDDRELGGAGGRAPRGCARAAARQLRHLDAGAARAVVDDARAPARPRRARAAAARAAAGAPALRPADGARRALGVRAEHRRPLLRLPRAQPDARPGCIRSRSSSPARWRSSCGRSSTRGRRWPTRSPTTPRRRASTDWSRPTTCWSAVGSSPR